MQYDDGATVGTGSNDTLALYALGTLGLGGLYVATHGRTLSRQHNEATASVEEPAAIKSVGQLGLLYTTAHAAERASFNSTSEDEKETREAAVVNLLRTMRKQHDAKALPATMTVQIVSRAGSSTAKVDEAKPRLNNECAKDGKQVSWWKAKYEASPLIGAGKHHLPMTFYLEATDSKGRRIAHYGLVKRLVVEADQDVMVDLGTKSTGVSYKMYLTLVDTNWRNAGGTPGKNSEIQIVASQQANRCAFSAIVKDGKTYDVFVSAFAFTLHSRVLKLTDPIKAIYEASGLVLEADEYFKMSKPLGTTLARVKFHASRDRLLSFISRSLPVLDPTVVWERDTVANWVRVGGRTSKTLLPLQVHIRSTERLNEEGDKHVRFHVLEMMMRYNAAPRDPGDLRDDPAYAKAVQFKLSDNSVLAQDLNDKNVWYVNEKKLDGEPTIDLVVLSRAPEKAGFKLDTEVPAVIDGAQSFGAFKAPLFGGSLVSLDKEVYDRQRAEFPAKADHDLVLEKDVIATPAAVFGDKSWMALVPFLVLFVAGWKLANPRLASAVAKLAYLGSAACALLVAGVAVAEYREVDEVVGYDQIILVAVMACVCLSLAASLFALRLSPDVSACVGVGSVVAILAVVAVYYLGLPHDSAMPGTALTNTRVVMMLAVAQALALLAIEMAKLESKVYSAPLPAALAAPEVSLMVFATSCIGMVYVFGYLGTYLRAPDGCLDAQAAVDYLGKQKPVAGSLGARVAAAEQDEAFAALKACDTNKLELPSAMTKSWWIPITSLIAALLVGQVASTYVVATLVRSVLPSSVAASPLMVIEDGRAQRGRWLFKSLVGLAVIGLVLHLLYPVVEWKSAECDQVRADIQRERAIVDAAVQPPHSERMTLVHDAATRAGCSTQETIAVTSATSALALLLLASMVVPVAQKYMYPQASSSQAFSLFAFASVVVLTGAWVVDPDTKEYFMKNRLTR
jgi:hypothetical protein